MIKYCQKAYFIISIDDLFASFLYRCRQFEQFCLSRIFFDSCSNAHMQQSFSEARLKLETFKTDEIFQLVYHLENKRSEWYSCKSEHSHITKQVRFHYSNENYFNFESKWTQLISFMASKKSSVMFDCANIRNGNSLIVSSKSLHYVIEWI